MTKQLHKLATQLQARLLTRGGPTGIERAVLDGWASLYRWHQAGERVWRIEEDDAPPALRDDLPLATAPIYAPGVCYHGPERAEWIVVARHAAAEPVYYGEAAEQAYAYPAPVITYAALIGTTLASGFLNLSDQPTPAALYLLAGRSAERWLDDDDIAPEETRLRRALRHWYRPSAIVV